MAGDNIRLPVFSDAGLKEKVGFLTICILGVFLNFLLLDYLDYSVDVDVMPIRFDIEEFKFLFKSALATIDNVSVVSISLSKKNNTSISFNRVGGRYVKFNFLKVVLYANYEDFVYFLKGLLDL